MIKSSLNCYRTILKPRIKNESFYLLTSIAKEFPETLEGVEAPAIEAARLVAARRNGKHLYSDNVSDMMGRDVIR